MARRCKKGNCRICGELLPSTFEHVPPKAAFNNQPVVVFGIQNWLLRDQDGAMPGGAYQQRGSGGPTLCIGCNSLTGTWYCPELSAWAQTGRHILSQLPPSGEWDLDPEPKMARVLFKSVYPLRFLKQIITMLFSANDAEFGQLHQELVSFVLNKEEISLPGRYGFYLALFWGPMARKVGLGWRINARTGEMDFLTEVAHPPFAYVMSVDAKRDVLPLGKISNFAAFRYDQKCDIELDMIVGFGHTPYPADYRSKAAIEADRAIGAPPVP